jgi:hypothetical protein
MAVDAKRSKPYMLMEGHIENDLEIIGMDGHRLI